MYVLEVVHIAIQTVIMETHTTLIVSNSVELYEKYVHIKACPARRYIPRAWGQVKMTFIPAPGKVNYDEVKGHCLIALLSFMQKTM
jgi:hypothetical protein